MFFVRLSNINYFAKAKSLNFAVLNYTIYRFHLLMLKQIMALNRLSIHLPNVYSGLGWKVGGRGGGVSQAAQGTRLGYSPDKLPAHHCTWRYNEVTYKRVYL